jgi:hypothetical protein
MRLRAGLGLLCAALAGCQHLPEGVKVDLGSRTVEVGPCRCRLPDKEKPLEPAPGAEVPVSDAPR